MLLKNSVLLDFSSILEEMSDYYYKQGYGVAFDGLPLPIRRRLYVIFLTAMVSFCHSTVFSSLVHGSMFVIGPTTSVTMSQ